MLKIGYNFLSQLSPRHQNQLMIQSPLVQRQHQRLCLCLGLWSTNLCQPTLSLTAGLQHPQKTSHGRTWPPAVLLLQTTLSLRTLCQALLGREVYIFELCLGGWVVENMSISCCSTILNTSAHARAQNVCMNIRARICMYVYCM